MAKRKFLQQAKYYDALEAAIAIDLAVDKEILRVYRPGNAKQDRAHRSHAKTLVIGGANRSGKSVVGCCEVASRITGQPIFGLDDNPIPLRFHVPKQGEISRYWFVGYNLDHIGQTFYRMFFEPGMGGIFTIIYDSRVGRYVKWNENDPWHVENASKKEIAEPLIPGRLIKENSWTWNPYGGGMAKKCFSSVELQNGAIIYAFPSTTPQPKQGDPIHGLFIDEDVAAGGHVHEYFQRLADFEGWAIWPAWPHDENYTLSNLIEGCKQAMEEGDERSEYILLTMAENPFFSSEKIKLAVDRMHMLGDEELVESRIYGIQGHEGRMMYDFRPVQHGIAGPGARIITPDLDTNTPKGILQHTYRTLGKFPDEWTRYLAIDPSTQRSAVLFGVVPPPEVEGVTVPPTLIVENEIVLRRTTPRALAMAVKEVVGSRHYEAFVLDKNFGRQRHFAAEGAATMEVLASAFREQGLRSRQTDYWFVLGCNKPQDRFTAVRELLYASEGEPVMYILLDLTPQTQKEFTRYYKATLDKKEEKIVLDEPENPRKFDCMAALEYLAHYVQMMITCRQHYVRPEAYSGDKSMSELASLVRGQSERNEYVHLGPGALA